MSGVALELINLEKRGIITCMEELLNVKTAAKSQGHHCILILFYFLNSIKIKKKN